ncbi:MAG: hypothetical protein MZU97_06985 [Bacillus subtilis]|nr:hypothetical protein [Bacillus subtilis]
MKESVGRRPPGELASPCRDRRLRRLPAVRIGNSRATSTTNGETVLPRVSSVRSRE